MAKVKSSATTDLGELVSDLVDLASDLPAEMYRAADLQLDYVAKAMRVNWDSMNPWQGTGTSRFVSDSFGHNVEFGDVGKVVVGSVGVFELDSVTAKHGRTEKDITAPQFAYWLEFGFTPNSGVTYAPLPFMSNAFYATLDKQDEIFANELAKSLGKRL